MIGARLRALRRAAGYTQYALARDIGRTQSDIYKWEYELLRIPAEELPALAACLGCDVRDFFTDEAPQPEEAPPAPLPRTLSPSLRQQAARLRTQVAATRSTLEQTVSTGYALVTTTQELATTIARTLED